jgi:hypothetical protein
MLWNNKILYVIFYLFGNIIDIFQVYTHNEL